MKTTHRFMTGEQRREHFEARVEALRGIFNERATKLDDEVKALDKQRRALTNVVEAIECAERIASQGMPGTAAAMLDDIAREADAVCEFYEAEQRILDAADLAEATPDPVVTDVTS